MNEFFGNAWVEIVIVLLVIHLWRTHKRLYRIYEEKEAAWRQHKPRTTRNA